MQIEYGKELQFLVYLIPVIMGIQLTFYFYFQYKKLKDEDLPLNRVLLAFGSFILFIVFGPLFIQIARNFLIGGLIYEIIYRVGWALAFSSSLAFSSFIIREDFSSVINLNFAKALFICNLIPIILVFILPSLKSPIFIGSIFFVVLNGLYIIRFQVILIQKSVGKVKRKIKFFLIGAIISLFALVFAILVGLQILPPILNEVVYFTGVFDLIFGFIVMYFSVYNFPPFYEFEWRENLFKLFIINYQNHSTLYSLDLIQDSHFKSDVIKKMFSKGISGIDRLITLITDSNTEKINKIQQDEYLIIFEHGSTPSSLIYVFIVKEDLFSSTHLLRIIKNQFESFFKEILINLEDLGDNQNQIFLSFNIIMDQILQKG